MASKILRRLDDVVGDISSNVVSINGLNTLISGNTTSISAINSALATITPVTTNTAVVLNDLSSNYYKLSSAYNRDVELNGKSISDALNTGSIVNTNSFYGSNTSATQSYRNVVDDYQSHHYYDRNGPNSENLQYLQLDSTVNYPSNLAAVMNASYYEDASSTYMFGVSTQSIWYSSPNPAQPAADDLNGMTKREIFNLLQDIGTITANDASGYAGFVEIWNKGYQNKNDQLTTGLATKLGVTGQDYILKYGGADDAWTLGNYQVVWRYDLKTRTVISRQVVNMQKTLDPSGDWLFAACGRGPVTSLGDGRFALTVPSLTCNSLLVFNKNLAPIASIIQNSFDTFTRGATISPDNFKKRGQLSFGIFNEQFNSVVSRKWNPSDLTGLTFKSLITGNPVNVFNTDDGKATFLYVNSSSQGQYGANEAISSFVTQGLVTTLADYKWNQAKGKIIQYSLFRDANNNNKWTIEPINVFFTCPDDYKPGDKLQKASFIVDPDTGVTQNLKIYYPLVDNRDIVTDISGYSSLIPTGAWNENWRQFKFNDGSSNTYPKTTGLQKLCVSIYDVSGSSWNVGGLYPTLYLDGRQFYQDVYGTVYKQFKDASTNRYYQQNDLTLGQVILTDTSCAFYPYSNPKQYRDLSSGLFYSWNDASAAYLSNGQFDPSPNATVRKNINNAGFCKRYMYAGYQLDPSANGIDSSNSRVATSGLTIPANCPFSDQLANANPQPPPYGARGKNTGALPINADFFFTHGHEFDSTKYYYSRPYSLQWVDKRVFTGTYANAATSLTNENYGKTKLLDASNVKAFFQLCQTAQGSDPLQHDVQVLLPNETFRDLSGELVSQDETVPSGYVVFKVKGSVLNGQPLVMDIHPNCAENLTLTPILCNQLNFYGAGIYGMPSWYQDSKGKLHLLTGSANGNYTPYSDMWYPAEYTAKKLCQDISGILNGRTDNELYGKVSKSTLIKFGFGNVDFSSQPSLSDPYSNVKSAIRDQSGNILLETTLRGITELRGLIGHSASQVKGAKFMSESIYNGDNTWVSFTGDKITDVKFDAATNFEWMFPNNPPKLTGKETLEMQELWLQICSYRQRPLSNRIKRWTTCVPVVLEPKTMTVEHIVRGPYDMPELFAATTRDVYKLTPESYLTDMGFNRDEVTGIVTCGIEYISSSSKTTLRLFPKRQIESKYIKHISYHTDISRNNFAIETYSALGTIRNDDNTYSYGSKQFYLASILASGISGTNSYLGNINGKDTFVYASPGLNNFSGHTIFFDALPKLEDCKYYFDDVRNIVATDDDKVWIIPPRNTAGIYKNFTLQEDRPQNFKFMTAYTISDDKKSVKPLWIKIIPTLIYPQLMNLASVGGDLVASSRGGVVLVNDLILESQMRELYIYNAYTGETIAKYCGNDFEYDEKNYRNMITTGAGGSSQAYVASIGCTNYASGELHLIFGARRFGNVMSSWGRQICALKIKRNDKLNMPYSVLNLGSGNVDVVFKPEDAINYNSGKFTLITSFVTTDRYGKLLPNYANIDLSYNMLYHTGITAIAVDTTSEYALSNLNNGLSIEDKIVNGGSWYENNGSSFNTIKSKILFLYAGPIPSRCARQTPYIVDSRQVTEAKSIRNQKILLTEYNRLKSPTGSTYPYPDNGSFIGGDTRRPGIGNTTGYLPLNTIKYNNYFNPSNLNDYNASFNKYKYSSGAPGSSQVWNQPLGYTDVGTGRPFTVPE